jgi:glycerol-3-phosphate dehydrogenase subunit C
MPTAVRSKSHHPTEDYELSLRLAKPLLDAIATGPPTAATDCPLAALQIEQGTGRKPKHPIEILAAAYGFEE